jgi:(2R)-3-sulfolactate dehydrogenase (NADP+)
VSRTRSAQTTIRSRGPRKMRPPLAESTGTHWSLISTKADGSLRPDRGVLCRRASSFLDAEGPAPATGQLILAIDPAATGGPGVLAHFAELAGAIAAQEGARLPGSRRHALRAAAASDGIEVAEETLATIRAI